LRRPASRRAVHRKVSAANGGSEESPWAGRAACCSGHVRWHQLSSLMSVSASVAGVVVSYPGRLQLYRAPGGVVHLRYGQAEPVPQAPQPFAAGPGDRLLQLPPGDEISRAGGGARYGCHVWCGQAAWVFMIWWGRVPVHGGLIEGFAGLPAWYRALMSSAGLGRRVASLSRAVEVFATHDRPQDRPQDSPQESARPRSGDGCARSARAVAEE